jgi:hypothetical protein
VTTWEKTIYPATVALASDVYQYGMNKAPSFYPPILKEAQILEQNPGDEAAKGALKAILDNLKADAQGRADKAAAVEKQITQFADDTAQDRTALVGPDGKSGLVSYYNDKYGSASADVVELNKQIVEQAGVLKAANDEYNHDVIVAATSPTYAWIWPLGTIAAAVVAGVYGKRATDALDAARAAQAKINALAASLAADANLMVAINSAQFGLNRIVADVAGALPVVQKIRGVWGGLSSDLASISQLIDDDIRNVPPIIMNLGVDEALKAWHNVALNADAYRVNAYVTPAPGALTMEAWQVANQFSSTRILAA